MGSTNLELDLFGKELKIPNYVNASMKDQLVGKTVADNECGIINLENSDQNGSHWVLFFKTPDLKIAYYSYGDPPCQELLDYLGKDVYTSDIQIQCFESRECGYYCLVIIYLLSKGVIFEDIILGMRPESN